MLEQAHTDVLVIGAGIAGLMAARTLTEQGLKVIVVERGEVPGGRMTTLQIGPGRADHGAQFITAHTPEFQIRVNRWQDEGLCFQWSTGWSSGSLGTIPADGNPRYAVRGGMFRLAAHLAEGLDVRLNSRITVVSQQTKGWLALDEKGRVYSAPCVLLAIPVPLALQLLRTGQVVLNPTDRAALESIYYEPCLAGIFWINGEVRLPDPGALQQINAPVAWIADNRRKGVSPEATLITVHAGASYSRELWHLPDWQALVALESPLKRYIDYDAEIALRHLERWTHAMPAQPYPAHYLLAADLPGLVFAGDSFGRASVEGAALSGLAAAQALVETARR
ncbi:MAG: FAD-dependent oxidoreductase [Chloroflexi bacterium]|nr:FAD-dependent oxidoreductase [Chloroflexota bacterium]